MGEEKQYRLPLWMRKFTFDFVTTLIPSLLAFNYIVPRDALIPALGTALASAGLAAALRNIEGMRKWLGEVLGVGDGA